MFETSYRLNGPTCISEDVEDDLIVINLASGRYYNMRNTTVLAWNAIMSGATPQALIDANQWANSHCVAFRDYVAFLLSENLIVPVQASIELMSPAIIELDCDENPAPFHVDVFTDMEEMLRLDPIHDADNVLGWPHKAV